MYITQAGVRLEIGRIPRQAIDDYLARSPRPEPPTKKVMVWGDIEEEVPIWDDHVYQAQVQTYYLRVGREQLDLIAPALTILDEVALAEVELEELRAIGVAGNGRADDLRFGVLVEDDDLTAVVAEVFYQSTVTQRGIDEAADGYAARWMDKPVLAWKAPELPAEYSPAFRDREAALFCGYSWSAFCKLTGPEQSACVAFYLIQQRLRWLASKLK